LQKVRESNPWIRAGLIVLVSAALSLAWLAVAGLVGKPGVSSAVSASTNRGAAVSEAVIRRIDSTPSGTSGQVTYVTPEYLSLTGGDPNQVAGATMFVFYEENHYRGLPETDQVVPPVLRVDGQTIVAPVEFKPLTDSGHHRTWTIRFPETKARHSLELMLPGTPGAATVEWDLPINYPQTGSNAVSIATFLTLAAGMVAALSPCLLQLTLYYLSTLAGVSLTRPTTRQIMTTAAWFVAGMTVAYTTGGALAGLAGQRLQDFGALGSWGRGIAITAGIGIVGMGIWTGASAGAPMLCKLPIPALTKMSRRAGALGAMAMGFVFSLGCLSCFGGAIFASVILYAGSLGSPLQGALLLGLFSLGIGVPFLAAAAAWSRIGPLLDKLQRYTPVIALGTSVVMVSFGFLMIADKFHWLSSLLIRWLPFLNV
jgi:cytochrome c-type biogenesis protein